MSINAPEPGSHPDHELSDTVVVSTPAQLRAIGDPLRSSVLDLLLERAAPVSELTAAIGRPKSTVAHHDTVLLDAGMLRVVRTRRVRAIDERYYGRTGRTLQIGVARRPWETETPVCVNELSVAATESVPAHVDDTLYSRPCDTCGSRPRRQYSSGGEWNWSGSAQSCHVRKRPSTASWPGSPQRTTRAAGGLAMTDRATGRRRQAGRRRRGREVVGLSSRTGLAPWR